MIGICKGRGGEEGYAIGPRETWEPGSEVMIGIHKGEGKGYTIGPNQCLRR